MPRRPSSALGAVAALALVAACDDAARDGGAAEPSRTSAAALVVAIGERLAREERASPDGDRQPPDAASAPLPAPLPARAPAWPGDLDFHPEARAESVELLAVLDDGAGRLWSVVRRFDRVAVRGAADRTPAAGDDFAFRDVLRLGGSTAAAEGTASGDGDAGAASVGAVEPGRPATGPRRRDALERVTLGLASAGPRTLRVRDATLALEPVADARSPCALDHVLSEGDGLALRLRQSACPFGTAVGALALATGPTLEARGTLVDDGVAHAVTGRAWVRRAWGEPPAPGGAVVFDRLLLSLDGVGLVEAERSKRRSGRGPRTASGRLRPAGAEVPSALEAIAWRDANGEDGAVDGGGAAGDTVPAGWSVSVPEAGVDVVLAPLVDAAIEDGAFGRVWLGAVRASGSHRGVGFVEFVPTGEADGAAAGAGS